MNVYRSYRSDFNMNKTIKLNPVQIFNIFFTSYIDDFINHYICR